VAVESGVWKDGESLDGPGAPKIRRQPVPRYISKYLQRHKYVFSPGHGTYHCKHGDFSELLLSCVRAPDIIQDVEYGRRGKMTLLLLRALLGLTDGCV
jgi:hypothetical protein